MKNRWNYRKSVLGASYDFLQNSRWNSAHYIIRLGFNGCAYVYDIRAYADMSKIDFNYFGYSLISSHKTVKQAKRKVVALLKLENEGKNEKLK